MKFGKQLELGTYKPWLNYYIAYGRLKRVIFRLVFLKSLQREHREGLVSNLSSRTHSFIELPPSGKDDIISVPSAYVERDPVDPLDDSTHEKARSKENDGGNKGLGFEYSKLTKEESNEIETFSIDGNVDYGAASYSKRKAFGSMDPEDEGPNLGDEPGKSSTDFFGLLQEEMGKINKFFLGKLASLRIDLEAMTTKFDNRQYTHHGAENGGHLDLLKLRDIYVELAALRSFSELNKTGFYKILKKYDKAVDEHPRAMKMWMPLVNKQPFTETNEPRVLMERIAQLVSRDKLIEWEAFATEEATKTLDDVFPSVRFRGLGISVACFALSTEVHLIESASPCAERCLSLLLLVVSLWVTEALPYYATALLILPLAVLMEVFRDVHNPDMPMEREMVANKVMSSMFNHTSFLLLGGYAISSAISRCQIEISVAASLQRLLGRRPKIFILAIMLLGLFLSMWISNHTAPILCSTIILPVVKDLPPSAQYTKALILGLAFACNFGGMMTPIASLQNVLAVSSLEQAGFGISFGTWIQIAVPFCIVCVLLCWLLLLLSFDTDDVKEIPLIVHSQVRGVGQKRSVTMVAASVLTVMMFATSSSTVDTFGDIGIISLLFMAFMCGTGLLTEVDFNSMSWHTLCLVGGGEVLGKAVASSGLLNCITHELLQVIPHQNEWLALCAILCFVCIVGTFISHSVAAIILMPIIVRMGIHLKMPEVVVIGSALAISSAMALPFSSFPNVNAVMLQDDLKEPFLRVSDFLRVGAPMTIISLCLIATLGMSLINLVLTEESSILQHGV